MTEEKLKIAFAGVSHWHVPLYFAGLPQHSVVGMSDPDPAIAARLAQPFSCPVYTDYRQMIRETKPDFVFAFAPHFQMKELADYLLEEGIPFSLEKPAGLNAGEVEALYNKAEQKKVFASIPFVWRYSDTVNDLKHKYLHTDIVHMSYRFIAGPPSRYLATSPWMLSRKTAGGGCMTNLGVHFIDMALYLADSKGAQVSSSLYQYGKEYDVELYATSLLKLDNGASLLLESGYAYPMSPGVQRENRWTIVTQDGYYILADNDLELREYDKEVLHVPLNTDSDVYYPVYTKTTLSDYVTGTRPRASLKEMLVVRQILDEMNARAEG